MKNPDVVLTNNDILKKLRIALELREEDMLEIIQMGGMDISKHELSALFRKTGHKHFKECGEQFMRIFMRGLTRWIKRNKEQEPRVRPPHKASRFVLGTSQDKSEGQVDTDERR